MGTGRVTIGAASALRDTRAVGMNGVGQDGLHALDLNLIGAGLLGAEMTHEHGVDPRLQ